ncbi:MAG: tetraacyldisaccharide 4'-kinase [Candidatus Methylomirabilia bacterium]
MSLTRIWEGRMPAPLAWPLAALAVGYRGLLGVREQLYDRQLLKTRQLPCPVISIGNLTVGGTGKTPATEFTVRTLKECGLRPGIVSRGYGRRTRGSLIVADPNGIRVEPAQAGDEPFLLASRLPGTPVVVGENRYEAARLCVERLGVQALVLDDAFQHRTLRKDLEIVLVSSHWPWGNGHLFPRGSLREPLGALARAHLVVVTGPSDGRDLPMISQTVSAKNPDCAVVTARYEPVECWEARSKARQSPAALRGVRLYAFAGIARPENFVGTLEELGMSVAGFTEFPDHHWYRAKELEALAQEATAKGAGLLITTEKDAIRCLGLALPDTPLWTLAVRLALTSGHAHWDGAFEPLRHR